MASKLFRWAVAAAAVLIVSGLLLLAAAHLPAVRAHVLERARTYVADQFGLSVEARSLDYNLLARSGTLRNVCVSAPGQPPFACADSARVRLSFRAFVGVIEIETLELSNATLAFVRHPDGSTNLPVRRGNPSTDSTPIRLGTVSIGQLQLTFDDKAAGRQGSLGPIDLTVDTRSASASPGRFGPSPFAIRAAGDEMRTLSGTIEGAVGFDGSRATVSELRVASSDGRISLDGWVDLIGQSPRLDVRGQASVDLSRAARFAGETGASLTGLVDATLAAAGPLADPMGRVTFEGQRIGYRSIGGIGLTGEFGFARGRVDVRRLELRSALGEIDASGQATFGERGTSTLVASWRKVDLDRLLTASGLDVRPAIGSVATGRLEATLQTTALSRSDWPSQIIGSASTRLSPAGSGLSLGGEASLNLRGGSWSIENSLKSERAALALAGVAAGRLASSAGDSPLTCGSRLVLSDLGAIVPVLHEAGIVLPAAVSDGLGGRVTADVTLGGTIRRPSARARISGRDLRAGNRPAADLDAELDADFDAIRATSVEARLGATSVTASGRYTWSGRFDARAAARAPDLDDLARRIGVADLPVAGEARLEGSASGTTRDPRAQATITAQRLSVDETPVGALIATLSLEGGRVTADAQAPDLAVRAHGVIDTRAPFDYDGRADFENANLAALVPARFRDRVRMNAATLDGGVRVKGNIRSPMPMPERVEARSLRLRLGKETECVFSGSLGRNPTSDPIAIRVNGVLSDLLQLGGPLLPVQHLAVDGSAAVDLHVGGTLSSPEARGTASVRASTLTWGEYPAARDITLDARIEPTRLVLESFGATWQEAKLAGQAEVPLNLIAPGTLGTPGTAGSVVLHATGITPRILAPFVTPSKLKEIDGALALTVRAEADALRVEAVRGSVVLDDAALTLSGVPFSQVVPTRVRFDRGDARIEDFRWMSLGNELTAAGSGTLTGPVPRIELALRGLLDLRILSAFAADIRTGGVARTDLVVTGPLAAPEITGRVGITDGEIRIATPPIVASDFEGDFKLASNRTVAFELSGLVNGGDAKIAGELNAAALDAPRGRVALTARSVALDYPEGLATESNADLTLTLGERSPTLTGRIDVLGGRYREPIVLTSGLLAALQQEVPTVAPSVLSMLRLNLALATSEDVRIDNNYGRLDVSGNIRVTGTVARPGAVGRIEAAQDGEIYLAGNTYRIDRLVVDLTSPRAIAPSLSFLAETRVGNVPIEVALECAMAGPCEREVRSAAAGVTNAQAEQMLFGVSTEPSVAGEQLARVLSGEVLGVVGRTVGLDTLRLEQRARGQADIFDDPTLVAGDVDPASRLTLGKRLGDNVELVYSQDLAENGFTWSTTYFAPYGISLRALLLDDQSRSYEFRHEPRFGASRRERPRRAPGPQIERVSFVGSPGFPESELRGRVRLGEGDRFDFARWQEDRRRLESFYRSRGFVEATIRARRRPTPVTLEYTINRGPATTLEVNGVDLPRETVERILERWSVAVFNGFLERDAQTIVREYLYREGHLTASVSAKMLNDEGRASKTLRLDVEPGPVVPYRLEFAGNEVVPLSQLYETARTVPPLTPWLDGAAFEQMIERVCREEGLLEADVDVKSPVLDAGASVVRVLIREGTPWTLGRVDIEGASALPETTTGALGRSPGIRYRSRMVADYVEMLERRFREAGYLQASVTVDTTVVGQDRRVDLAVRATPGRRSILTGVIVEGADARKPLVARAITLTPGGPVDATALGTTRRRLYDTNVFRSVEIALEPVPDVGAPQAAEQPVVARVRLEERPRYRFRYGLAFRDDVVSADERQQRLAFAADFEDRNLFGRGATAGLSTRISRDQQVGRVNLGSSRFFGLPLRSNVFLSRGREQINPESDFPTISDVTDISAEQAYRLRRSIEWRYGYAFGRNRTFIENQDFDVRVKVARLTTSALVDRRADPFDPSGGWFASGTIELSREGLGSDLNFLRSYFQYSQFMPLRGKTVLASAVRLGLARTFAGEELIPSERFFAGGAMSVRGYREDDLGPRSILGDAEGGRALLILNAEGRFPLYRWIRGVGFIDLGNVYPTVSDVSFSDLLVGVGAGLRFLTPIGLLRFDLAAPVNARPFDPNWRVHFGLGHAF